MTNWYHQAEDQTEHIDLWPEKVVASYKGRNKVDRRSSAPKADIFNSHGPTHGTRWQCTAKTFKMACSDAYMLNLT